MPRQRVRPRLVRLAAAALVPWLPACAGGDGAGVSAAAAASAVSAASTGAAEVPVDDFRPGFSPDDAAAASVDRFLALSLPGAAPGPGELEALLGCDMATAHPFPTELLADYEITGRSTRGDTVVVRARVVTAAEQDHSRREPGRFTATQRVRQGEWEWDVVLEDGAWKPCAGPRFGLVAPESLTTWRPDGASAVTARELAASLRGGAGAP